MRINRLSPRNRLLSRISGSNYFGQLLNKSLNPEINNLQPIKSLCVFVCVLMFPSQN